MAYRYHYHHRPPRRHCCSRRGGAGKRVLYILAVGVVVAAAVSMFRGSSDRAYVSPPPAPARLSEMSPSRLQEHEVDSGIVGGAAAAEKALAARPTFSPNEEPGPNRTVTVSTTVPRRADTARPVVDLSPGKPKPPIKFQIRSDKLYPNREMALNDALVMAGIKLRDELRGLDPPVEAHPGWVKIKSEYLQQETVAYIPPSDEDKKLLADQGIDGTHMVWAEIDVEVTDKQIRDLRSEDRVGSGGLVAGVGFVLVLALFGFLRLDAWTRGYLTGGLAVAAVAAAGAAVALLVLA